MRTLFSILIIWCFLVVSGCGGGGNSIDESTEMQVLKDGGDITTPEEIGVKRAKKDIAAGKLQILHYGAPWSVGKPLFDEESGLPVRIVADCSLTTEFVTETDAYNRTMRREAKSGKSER